MSDRWTPAPIPQGDPRHDIGDETRAAIVLRLMEEWRRDPDLTPEKVRQLAMWAGASVRALLSELGTLRNMAADTPTPSPAPPRFHADGDPVDDMRESAADGTSNPQIVHSPTSSELLHASGTGEPEHERRSWDDIQKILSPSPAAGLRERLEGQLNYERFAQLIRVYITDETAVHALICDLRDALAAAPAPTPRWIVGIDWGKDESRSVYLCRCGDEFQDEAALRDHLSMVHDLEVPAPAPTRRERPNVICLCGSTKFIETFAVKTWELELEGNIVLGCTLLPSWYCPVRDHFAETLGVKGQRDEQHLRKIDMADEVLVLNVGGYIGESTWNEIAYATKTGKPVKYLEAAPVSQAAPSATPGAK